MHICHTSLYPQSLGTRKGNCVGHKKGKLESRYTCWVMGFCDSLDYRETEEQHEVPPLGKHINGRVISLENTGEAGF